MKRNRKVPKKMSVVAANSMRFGAIVVFFFVMVIMNLLSSSSCTMLLKEKGAKERELAKYEEARMQEATRWDGMKSADKLEAALVRHGLAMRFAHSDQCVNMRPDGTPYPNQRSVRLARNSEFGSPQPAMYRQGRLPSQPATGAMRAARRRKAN